jgi:UDP-N-acetylglucosamine--N-acetylmuramyl-(pentapeptide) pyrophosphoryl-undecaprenol N-acetylglucosamine transferase
MEPEMIARSGIQWAGASYIWGGAVHGVNPLRMLTSTIKLVVGLLQALVLVLRHRPDSVFITGGWASLPVALAAWLLRVPVYGFVPDIEPGLTLKIASRFARRVAATTIESAPFFRTGQVVETGYPLRPEVVNATREAAVSHFGLNPACRTLLVTGGSSGARSINRTMLAILPEVLKDDHLQVIHISGKLDWAEVAATREALPLDAQARYHAYAYLHDDMGLAIAAADLVVSRAGASTLGEFAQFGLPAILVPYPYAWRYQKVNADYLVSRGAAVRLDDEKLPMDLLPTVRRLLGDPATLGEMAVNSRRLARPDGARHIARLLMKLEGQ